MARAGSAADRVGARGLRFAGMLLALGVIIGVMLTSMYAGPAVAHTVLVSSVPAKGSALAEPPSRLELVFGADLNAQFVSVALTHAGTQVPVGAPNVVGARITADVTGDMPPDRYRTAYKVVGNDGHVMTGEVGFVVLGLTGAAGRQTPAAAIDGGSGGGVVRWILAAAVLGLVAVGVVMTRDALARRR